MSFYVRELPTIRRKFLGLMPSGGGTAKVEIAAMAQSEALQQVQRWQDDLSSLRAALGSAAGPMTDDDLQDLLFDYEVSLGFVNAKAHGTLIADELTQLSDDFAGRGKDPIEVEVLTGEVTVTQLAGAIARIEDEKRTDPRAERLRALVGTSVVSHGVDLERLNVMVMAGLPSTTADYIQATSRSGRSHVGLVVTIYDDYQRRESSTFTHFHPSHRLIDMLVEPVPVNRFARRAADRTLPGTVMALLWDLARDPQHGAPAEGIRRTKQFQKWWNTSAATLDSVIVDRIKASYRSPVPGVNPPKQEDELADSAAVRWAQIERKHVAQFNTDRTVQLFANKVMTSLRDVDEGVGFEGFGHSRTLYRHMFPERF